MIIEPVENASELKACCDIWLAASTKGHAFVAGNFWREKYDDMLALYLPQSSVHIARIEGTPAGFSATSEDRLEALFVHPDMWGQGIGKALLMFLFAMHDTLRLAVYQPGKKVKISFFVIVPPFSVS